MCGPSPPPPQRLIITSRPGVECHARAPSLTLHAFPRPRDKSTLSPHAHNCQPCNYGDMDRDGGGARTSLIEVWNGATASISASTAASRAASCADEGNGCNGFTEVSPGRMFGKSSLS
ncbi:unnamed protein product [Lota lota]